MGRRARILLILLILAGAAISTAVVVGRPGAFVLEQTIPVHREDRPEQAAFVPGKNSVLFGARYKPITIFDLTTVVLSEIRA